MFHALLLSNHHSAIPRVRNDKNIAPQMPIGLLSDNATAQVPSELCASTACKKPKCMYGKRSSPRAADAVGRLSLMKDLKSQTSPVNNAKSVQHKCSLTFSLARSMISCDGVDSGSNGQLSAWPFANPASLRRSTFRVT